MSAAVVMVCECGHNSRAHEGGVEDPSFCLLPNCACSSFRDDEDGGPDLIDLEPPLQVVASLPRVCTAEGCDRSFDTGQGLAMHRRRAHEGFRPAKVNAPKAAKAAAPAVKVQPPVEDVSPDELLVALVDALDSIQDASPGALVEQAFAVRAAFAERGWSVTA